MSKILVLGRTMDMGGTEVAMAALLQKLVEKKEDVTLLLVEKRGVLLERIPKEVEVRQMIWDKKPHPALERIVGKRETPAERSFYARGMGVFLMRVVYGKKRYGKLYERILECVEPETKQYDLVFDFFGFGAFTTAFGARKTNARKKAVWFHGENLWWLFRTRDFIPEYDKIYCVSEPVRKQVIARFPELADRTEVLLNFIDIKQVQRRSEEPLSDPQYTGELKFLTVGRASEEKGYDIAVQITAELKKRGLCFKWFIRQFPVLEFAFQFFPSQTGVLGVLLAQRGLDPGAGLRRGDEPQPVGFGLLILLRQHFDDVSVVEYVADRRRTVIDLAARAGEPQRGVDVEGEIQHRGSFGQLAQVAAGGEDENFARGGLGVEVLGQRTGLVFH